MEIPGLGPVTKHERFEDWYLSDPMPVSALRGKSCRIVVEGYDDDPNREDFHAAISNFLSARDLLGEAEPHVYRYYEDVNSAYAG
jgi:hypothetical protein